MREKEMERMIERDRKRERKREKMEEEMEVKYKEDKVTEVRKITYRRRMRDELQIKNMSSVALNSLGLTIRRLVNSSRVSIDPCSRAILMFAEYGVKEAVELCKSLEEFRDRVESKRMKALEGEIREAAWKLEDVLDSRVSDQSETESIQVGGDEGKCALLFSLNLEGIEQDIDGFVEKVVKMEKLLNPWFGEEEEEDDQPRICVTRSWFLSWFATKAASVFLGMKEEYIRELEKLLPEGKEDDDYVVLFRSAFSRSKSEEDRVSKIKDELIIWWINKAASIFVKEDKDEEKEKEEEELFAKDGDAVVVSSITDPPVNMVGLTDLFCQLRDDLIGGQKEIICRAIVGMAGIGKTSLAKKILQDPLIASKFEYRIFVRTGPGYQWDDIVQVILAQLPDGGKMLMKGDDDLNNVKCLIVLDDVWNKKSWDIKGLPFPWKWSRYKILFTTRKYELAKSVAGAHYEVSFLDKKESWDLLRGKIFDEKRCPPQLEKAGKKIAVNCEGLPLLIVTVADLLSKVERTPEYWWKIAANKTNSIFVDAYEQVSEVIYPSYSDLSQHLKACFLYFGAFPQNDKIRLSKLIILWSADGFLGVSYTHLHRYVNDFLVESVWNTVVLATRWSTLDNRLKVFTLHSVFWYLSKREARNEKFLHVLNSYKDIRVEDIECQRRLSIYKNVILSRKDVRDTITSMSVVRSLLCTGPYHLYQVPIDFGLRLLKVLDTLTIRFYEFPIDVLELVQLRYLALCCNGNLPRSISKLWGLQSMILHQHLSIKSSVASQSTYLPVEIWDLQELEYLQIVGRNLPDPPPGVVLTSLLILLDVGAHTCTKRVLGGIPNLQKLRVQIELMPGSAEPQSFCDDISHLQELTSLQFVVVNPELRFETVSPPPSFSFSKFIVKLTLSGFGYPWEYMSVIAELSSLKELKLKCYAFQGTNWEIKAGEFRSLRCLTIEDTDLVKWTGVINLESLIIRNCYKLQEIPKFYRPIFFYSPARVIVMDDCNPSAVTCARKMATNACVVRVYSSWLDDAKWETFKS